jgi:hypothetical protein
MPTHTAAAAAKLEALPANETGPAKITAIYKPKDGFKDSNIINVEMSLDIFSPSTKEIVDINMSHPTLGFKFQLTQMAAQPIIKSCKSGTQAAKLKNWRSRIRHGTIQAIDSEYVNTIENIHLTIQWFLESNQTKCKITIGHHKIAQPLMASGIPQVHFDQLHAIAPHLHACGYGKDHNLWGEYGFFPAVDKSTIHNAITDAQVTTRFTPCQLQKRTDW